MAQCRFGPVPFDGARADFYDGMNFSVTDMIRSLPRPVQAGAMLLYMAYAGIAVGEKLDFFRNYYVPTWSVIPWTIDTFAKKGTIPEPETGHLQRLHAMAMLLHSLDDHLNDGEIPPSHEAVLIRSQAWHLLLESLQALALENSARDRALALVDEYYGAITGTADPESLDDYCNRFKKQMATGLVAPFIAADMCGLSGEFLEGLRDAQERFGVAWRLLDDIQDAEDDFLRGEVSAVYQLLPESARKMWKSPAQGKSLQALAPVLHKQGVFQALARRIVHELAGAADRAEEIGLPGLAKEFQLLAAPIVDKEFD